MTSTVPPAEEVIVIRKRPGPLGCAWRLGCLIVWLPLILLPLALIVLAVQGEIALWHNAGFPAGSEHPFFQAKLLMDADTRGLNLTRSYISTADDANNTVCVQTHVRYVLWQGEGPPADYCDCYRRDGAERPWQLASTNSGTCE